MVAPAVSIAVVVGVDPAVVKSRAVLAEIPAKPLPAKSLIAPESTKRAEDSSLNVTVEWAAVERAIWRQLSLLVPGSPQLTTSR